MDYGYLPLDRGDKFPVNPGLYRVNPLFRPENLLLVLFEFFGYIPFGIDQGLLADPFGKNFVLVGVAYFYIVTEDIVVADFEGRDS